MANSQKQVLDMRPGKGFSAAQSNEHTRNWTEKGWQHAVRIGNYDRTRESLNFEIAGGKIRPMDKGKSIPERIRENLSSRNIKDPNERLAEPKFRTVANFIFGGSRERMLELAFGNQKVDLSHGADNSHIKRNTDIENWALDVYHFVADKWGEENIAAFIVHLDELNPHVHCTLLPIDKDKKFAYKKMFAGSSIYEYKQRMIELHNEFAAVNGKWGLNRGDSIAETGARHRTTEEYRRALSHECTSLEEQISESRMLLKQLNNEVAFAQKRVKGLTTMITNLERKKEELEHEMTDISSQIRAGQGDSMELQKRIDKLSGEYEKTLGSLADKRQKLTEANRKLTELQELAEESKEKADEFRNQAEEYRQAIRESSADMTRQVHYRIADAAVTQAIHELKNIIPPEILSHESLDGSFIRELSEHGNSFLKCATMLFVGYIDGATAIAKDCGGGGTSSDLPWGRDDDDDDLRWARKCLVQASRMMRPASGKSVKRK